MCCGKKVPTFEVSFNSLLLKTSCFLNIQTPKWWLLYSPRRPNYKLLLLILLLVFLFLRRRRRLACFFCIRIPGTLSKRTVLSLSIKTVLFPSRTRASRTPRSVSPPRMRRQNRSPVILLSLSNVPNFSRRGVLTSARWLFS